MSKTQFYYRPEDYLNPKTNKLETIYKPVIPIRLQYGHRLVKIPVECLVDSGSDTNLFPAVWGLAAGIKIEKGEKKSIHGIGGIELIAYRHSVKLWVNSKQISTFVDFSFNQSLPLLGRIDFFKFFSEVIFNENKRYIELDL